MAQHESWLERAAPLTGIAFVALSVVGAVIAFGDAEFLGPGEELASYYEDNDERVVVGGALVIVSVPFLLWFMGSLWRTLRDAEGARRRLSVVAFGGGVSVGVTTLLVGTTQAAAGSRAGEAGTLSGDYAAAMYDVGGLLGGVAVPVAFAAVLGAFALVALRTGVFPAWFGWASGVLAVGLLAIPIAWITVIGAFAWVVVMSVWLYVRGGAAPSSPAQAAAGAEPAAA